MLAGLRLCSGQRHALLAVALDLSGQLLVAQCALLAHEEQAVGSGVGGQLTLATMRVIAMLLLLLFGGDQCLWLMRRRWWRRRRRRRRSSWMAELRKSSIS